MRILSVVTLVTPDGDYGGPLRVAVNQALALRERGHEVTLVAAHRGFSGPPPTSVGGVPARLFPARRVVPRTGFAGLSAPGMIPYLRSAARDHQVAHIHLARDLVTLPATVVARRAALPYVVQCHGMIDASKSPLARFGDPLLTRPALADAAKVLYLTPAEHEGLRPLVQDPDQLQHLPNGVPVTDLVADPGTPEVLYLARLAPRKRPGLLVHVADALATEFPQVRYRLVGPDEGEGPAVRAAIAGTPADVVWEGPLDPDRTLERMARAGIFVLPSVDEPYPMSVLEAMSTGLAVVLTDSCGLAPLVERTGAGIVVDSRAESLVAAVRLLLGDPAQARDMGQRGREAVRREQGMAAIGGTLETLYASAAAARG